MNRHDVDRDTLRCRQCGLFAFECVTLTCDLGRLNGGPQRRTGVFGAGLDMIEDFKAQWPCHGLPDNLNCVVAHFNSRGDLVDLETFDAVGEPLDTSEFDGSALLALVNDIQDHGYEARPDGAEMVTAIHAGKDW